MSQAILISIRPEWCQKIISGEKTIEIRKTRPRLPTPFKCYIYQTKPKKGAEDERSGKVIGEFVCDYIHSIYPPYSGKTEGTCLTRKQIYEYSTGDRLYYWHISELCLYDIPLDTAAFRRRCIHADDDQWDYSCLECNLSDQTGDDVRCGRRVERAPQSWCVVEERS